MRQFPPSDLAIVSPQWLQTRHLSSQGQSAGQSDLTKASRGRSFAIGGYMDRPGFPGLVAHAPELGARKRASAPIGTIFIQQTPLFCGNKNAERFNRIIRVL